MYACPACAVGAYYEQQNTKRPKRNWHIWGAGSKSSVLRVMPAHGTAKGVGSPPKPPLGLTHSSSPHLASYQFLKSPRTQVSNNYFYKTTSTITTVLLLLLLLLLLGCVSDMVVVKKVWKPRLRPDFEASSWKSSLISSYKKRRHSRILSRGVIWPHLYFRKKTMACCRSLGL